MVLGLHETGYWIQKLDSARVTSQDDYLRNVEKIISDHPPINEQDEQMFYEIFDHVEQVQEIALTCFRLRVKAEVHDSTVKFIQGEKIEFCSPETVRDSEAFEKIVDIFNDIENYVDPCHIYYMDQLTFVLYNQYSWLANNAENPLVFVGLFGTIYITVNVKQKGLSLIPFQEFIKLNLDCSSLDPQRTWYSNRVFQKVYEGIRTQTPVTDLTAEKIHREVTLLWEKTGDLFSTNKRELVQLASQFDYTHWANMGEKDRNYYLLNKKSTFILTSGYNADNTVFFNVKTRQVTPLENLYHENGRVMHIGGQGFLYARYKNNMVCTLKNGQHGWSDLCVKNDGSSKYFIANPWKDLFVEISVSNRTAEILFTVTRISTGEILNETREVKNLGHYSIITAYTQTVYSPIFSGLNNLLNHLRVRDERFNVHINGRSYTHDLRQEYDLGKITVLAEQDRNFKLIALRDYRLFKKADNSELGIISYFQINENIVFISDSQTGKYYFGVILKPDTSISFSALYPEILTLAENPLEVSQEYVRTVLEYFNVDTTVRVLPVKEIDKIYVAR